MTTASPPDYPRARAALAAGESVLVLTKGTADLVKGAGDAGEAFSAAKPGRAGGLTFLVTAAAAKKVFGAARPLVGERDRGTVARIDQAVSAVVSCGGFGLAAVTVGVTGGLTAFVTITQGIACAKDLLDLATTDETGRGFFDQSAGHKWAGLALDTAGFVGALFGIGARAAVRPAAGLIAGLVAKASGAERVAAAAELSLIGVKGVGIVLEPAPGGGAREAAPAPGQVEQALDASGLPWRNPLLDPECLFLKVSPRCLPGDPDGRPR